MGLWAKEVAELKRLIDVVENHLKAAGNPNTLQWREHTRKGEAIISSLVSAEGAQYRYNPPDGNALTLAGIRTTCTAGTFGLLRNWQNAARRRIEQIEARFR